jgi:Cd2+/Zn2+-exporting ATPase
MQKLSYKIYGMDCAEEVNALKRTVGKLPGIADLDFNLIDGTMTVQFDACQVNEVSILDAARRAGLEADAVDETCPSGVCAIEEGWWTKRSRAVMCWCSGALVLAGFVTHALLHGDLLHALTAGEGLAHHQFPLPVILLYAAAVVTGGWFFAPKAWMALRRLRADMNLLMTIAVIGAMIIGQWFEAGTVTFLFALSLLLESWSVGRARRAIRALVNMTPPTARFIGSHDADIM